ncbi:response regulator [Tumidithrix elongata RA019]|uniref:Response regulator n=1 Tax=Tumidithrix elongata BACA0141 TaxID=2716417 RepID=A0AAW9PT92_9CYAN|nr:response regulator [Tumidithrix elongata RA019]
MDVKKLVLVVEDSPTQREAIASLLRSHGFEVISTSSGGEALQYLHEFYFTPDLIVLDVVMPYPNGYEVCRRVRQHKRTQAIPILLCSSQCSESSRYWGLKNGANAYVSKPFYPEEFLTVVRKLLAIEHLVQQ